MKKKTISGLSISLAVALIAAPFTATAAMASSEEAAIIRVQTNEVRTENGVKPLLQANIDLDDLAQQRAEEIQTNYGHLTNAELQSRMPAGAAYYGENIQCNLSAETVVYAGWMNSAGHKANLLNKNYNMSGVGYSVVNGVPCAAQIFAYYAVATEPAAPAAVTAEAASSSEAIVYWDTPNSGGSNILNYTISAIRVDTGEVIMRDTNNASTSYMFTGLESGRTYRFAVTASNSVGTSEPSPVSADIQILPGVPDAPQIPSATLTSGTSANVSWTAPAFDGGAPVTGYTVTQTNTTTGDERTVNVGANITSYEFTGLRPGSVYNYTIAAKNRIGSGEFSSASANINAPAIKPTEPTAVTLSETADGLKAEWFMPEFDGGADVTNYEVTFTPETGTPVVVTVSGQDYEYTNTELVPGMFYTLSVKAINSVGASPAAAYNDPLMSPYVVPSEPLNVNVKANADSSATVTWKAPAQNGGTPVTGYTVTLYDETSNRTVVATLNNPVTTHTFTYLTPGSTYSAYVTATNKVGASTESQMSPSVTLPAQPPELPLSVNATVTGIREATVTWEAPIRDNGAPIEGYLITLTNVNDEGDTQTQLIPADTYEAVFTGLKTKATYEASAVAYNSAGNSGTNTGNTVEIPVAPEPPAQVQFTSETTTNDATVSWEMPSNGGMPITEYRISFVGPNVNEKFTVDPEGNTYYVSGLERYTEYTFTITAVNNIGESEVNSGTVLTKAETPTAPVNVTAEIIDGESLLAEWAAPVDNGGAEITGYVVRVYSAADGKLEDVLTTANTSIGVYGLKNGTEYYITVSAKNVDESSVESGSSEVVKTFNVPTAVNNLNMAFTTDTTVLASWTQVTDNGGTPVTGYRVTLTDVDGKTVGEPILTAGYTAELTDLEYGASYTITVEALNVVGASAPATLEVEVPAVVPGDVTEIVLSASKAGNVTVNWVAPTFNGGSNVTGYTVTLYNGDTTIVETVKETGTSHTFTGLLNGGTYYASIVATNGVGDSETAFSSDITIPTTVPTVPVDASATTTKQTVEVNWSAPLRDGGETITGYRVTLLDADNKVVDEGTTDGETRSYEFTDLTPGAKFTAVVKAVNSEGTSFGVTTNSVTIGAVAPGAVEDINVNVMNRNTASVTWDAAYDGAGTISSYNVTLTNNTTQETSEGFVTGEELAIQFTGLDFETEYTVNVSAVNEIGEGPAGAATFTTGAKPSVPNTVTDVKASTEGSTVTVGWVAPTFDGGSAVTGYEVTITPDSGEAMTVKVAADRTDVVFKGVLEYTRYTSSVKALNAVGASEAVDGNSVVTEPVSEPVEAPSDENLPKELEVDLTKDGNIVTVKFKNADFEWVYGYAFSTPVALGWQNVNDNIARFNVSGVTAAGEHTLVMYDFDGQVVAWGNFTVAAEPVVIDENNDGNSNNDEDSSTAGPNRDDGLAVTGNESGTAFLAAMGLLFAGAAVMVVARRTRKVAVVRNR